jgi:hypothetical protein
MASAGSRYALCSAHILHYITIASHSYTSVKNLITAKFVKDRPAGLAAILLKLVYNNSVVVSAISTIRLKSLLIRRFDKTGNNYE